MTYFTVWLVWQTSGSPPPLITNSKICIISRDVYYYGYYPYSHEMCRGLAFTRYSIGICQTSETSLFNLLIFIPYKQREKLQLFDWYYPSLCWLHHSLFDLPTPGQHNLSKHLLQPVWPFPFTFPYNISSRVGCHEDCGYMAVQYRHHLS